MPFSNFLPHEESRVLWDRLEGLIGQQVIRLRIEDEATAFVPASTLCSLSSSRISLSSPGRLYDLSQNGTLTDHLQRNSNALYSKKMDSQPLNGVFKKALTLESQLHQYINPSLVTTLNRRAAKATFEAELMCTMIDKLRKESRQSATEADRRQKVCELTMKLKSLLSRQKCEWQCVGRLKETLTMAREMKGLLKFICQLSRLLEHSSEPFKRMTECPPPYELCNQYGNTYKQSSSDGMCGVTEMSDPSLKLCRQARPSQSEITISLSLDFAPERSKPGASGACNKVIDYDLRNHIGRGESRYGQRSLLPGTNDSSPAASQHKWEGETVGSLSSRPSSRSSRRTRSSSLPSPIQSSGSREKRDSLSVESMKKRYDKVVERRNWSGHINSAKNSKNTNHRLLAPSKPANSLSSSFSCTGRNLHSGRAWSPTNTNGRLCSSMDKVQTRPGLQGRSPETGDHPPKVYSSAYVPSSRLPAQRWEQKAVNATLHQDQSVCNRDVHPCISASSSGFGPEGSYVIKKKLASSGNLLSEIDEARDLLPLSGSSHVQLFRRRESSGVKWLAGSKEKSRDQHFKREKCYMMESNQCANRKIHSSASTRSCDKYYMCPRYGDSESSGSRDPLLFSSHETDLHDRHGCFPFRHRNIAVCLPCAITDDTVYDVCQRGVKRLEEGYDINPDDDDGGLDEYTTSTTDSCLFSQEVTTSSVRSRSNTKGRISSNERGGCDDHGTDTDIKQDLNVQDQMTADFGMRANWDQNTYDMPFEEQAIERIEQKSIDQESSLRTSVKSGSRSRKSSSPRESSSGMTFHRSTLSSVASKDISQQFSPRGQSSKRISKYSARSGSTSKLSSQLSSLSDDTDHPAKEASMPSVRSSLRHTTRQSWPNEQSQTVLSRSTSRCGPASISKHSSNISNSLGVAVKQTSKQSMQNKLRRKKSSHSSHSGKTESSTSKRSSRKANKISKSFRGGKASESSTSKRSSRQSSSKGEIVQSPTQSFSQIQNEITETRQSQQLPFTTLATGTNSRKSLHSGGTSPALSRQSAVSDNRDVYSDYLVYSSYSESQSSITNQLRADSQHSGSTTARILPNDMQSESGRSKSPSSRKHTNSYERHSPISRHSTNTVINVGDETEGVTLDSPNTSPCPYRRQFWQSSDTSPISRLGILRSPRAWSTKGTCSHTRRSSPCPVYRNFCCTCRSAPMPYSGLCNMYNTHTRQSSAPKMFASGCPQPATNCLRLSASAFARRRFLSPSRHTAFSTSPPPVTHIANIRQCMSAGSCAGNRMVEKTFNASGNSPILTWRPSTINCLMSQSQCPEKKESSLPTQSYLSGTGEKTYIPQARVQSSVRSSAYSNSNLKVSNVLMPMARVVGSSFQPSATEIPHYHPHSETKSKITTYMNGIQSPEAGSYKLQSRTEIPHSSKLSPSLAATLSAQGQVTHSTMSPCSKVTTVSQPSLQTTLPQRWEPNTQSTVKGISGSCLDVQTTINSSPMMPALSIGSVLQSSVNEMSGSLPTCHGSLSNSEFLMKTCKSSGSNLQSPLKSMPDSHPNKQGPPFASLGSDLYCKATNTADLHPIFQSSLCNSQMATPSFLTAASQPTRNLHRLSTDSQHVAADQLLLLEGVGDSGTSQRALSVIEQPQITIDACVSEIQSSGLRGSLPPMSQTRLSSSTQPLTLDGAQVSVSAVPSVSLHGNTPTVSQSAGETTFSPDRLSTLKETHSPASTVSSLGLHGSLPSMGQSAEVLEFSPRGQLSTLNRSHSPSLTPEQSERIVTPEVPTTQSASPAVRSSTQRSRVSFSRPSSIVSESFNRSSKTGRDESSPQTSSHSGTSTIRADEPRILDDSHQAKAYSSEDRIEDDVMSPSQYGDSAHNEEESGEDITYANWYYVLPLVLLLILVLYYFTCYLTTVTHCVGCRPPLPNVFFYLLNSLVHSVRLVHISPAPV